MKSDEAYPLKILFISKNKKVPTSLVIPYISVYNRETWRIFFYIYLDIKRIQKEHTQISHILHHPPNVHIIPFHAKNNF